MSRPITPALLGSLLASLVLVPNAALAAVTVQDSPAFEVRIDGNAVAVSCSGGKVRLTIDGVASMRATSCADVTSLKVVRTGHMPDRIDLSGVDRAAFTALDRRSLQPMSGFATLDTFEGDDGDNVLIGTPDDDTINGHGGNDTIDGDAGIDTIDGGDGNDTITGGPGNDTLLGGNGNDTFIWNPGDGSDTIQGGTGVDTLVFNGSAGNEVFAVTAEGGGFRFTRDLGNIVMTATDVEAITLNALAGDDHVTTVGLPGTSQNLIGGTQTTADVLTIDAAGGCVTSGSGTVTVAGAQPITFSEFEQVNVVNQCLVAVAANVPTLGPLALAALAAFLALAGLVLVRWKA